MSEIGQQHESHAMSLFAENVRRIMSEKGISQRHLAVLTGIAHSNISRILSGKEGITIERAEKIADALDAKLPKLLEEKRKKVRVSA